MRAQLKCEWFWAFIFSGWWPQYFVSVEKLRREFPSEFEAHQACLDHRDYRNYECRATYVLLFCIQYTTWLINSIFAERKHWWTAGMTSLCLARRPHLRQQLTEVIRIICQFSCSFCSWNNVLSNWKLSISNFLSLEILDQHLEWKGRYNYSFILLLIVILVDVAFVFFRLRLLVFLQIFFIAFAFGNNHRFTSRCCGCRGPLRLGSWW